MKRLRWLIANGMAAFMDFGVGTLIAVLVGLAFQIEVPLWYLAIGGVLAFLPDFDVIWPILRQALLGRKIVGDHHTTLMHRPLLVVPLATLAAYIIGGEYWAVTTLLCVTWHYTHDTPEFGGGGIAWAWPFSSKFRSFRGVHESLSTDHDEWIANNWLKPSALSVREVTVGLIALTGALVIALRTI